MFQNHKYATWSDTEIRKLIDATNIHKDKTIDWIGVASHFPGRTSQQCKSFYNNRVKPLETKTDSMVNDFYLFMISTQMQKPRTPSQNVKKLFCECGTADMFIYIVNLLGDNLEFKFNYQFMGAIVEVIEIHLLVSEYLKTEFAQNNYVEIGEYVMSKEMYEIMVMRMASFDATAVLQKIQDKVNTF
ncbi:Myb-like_DNA-binding domain-containing protein [Hexamita inflata]|uniref:Myb-like DNA-binding domain-containing protein n=1 Tax=Hexamita inflata TaxID=28002 RepID=A0AA86PJ54_9EUKA|nr:Myb-like DNA-binding domain-containing protein [Hexamita inflata]